ATMASPAISFPPNTAQRWTLANGLTLIVQEDRSAPVASVQAWCATGSTTEDKHLGAGLSHILEHMLFKGTNTRSTNEIAQTIQEQVMECYKPRYVPNNLTFIVVGDVVAAEVWKKLEDLFKDQPAKSLAPIYIPAEPPQLGLREVHQEFATELTHFAMAWHVPDISQPDVPALDLLSVILGEGHSSRLYRKVREETGLAFAISV